MSTCVRTTTYHDQMLHLKYALSSLLLLQRGVGPTSLFPNSCLCHASCMQARHTTAWICPFMYLPSSQCNLQLVLNQLLNAMCVHACCFNTSRDEAYVPMIVQRKHTHYLIIGHLQYRALFFQARPADRSIPSTQRPPLNPPLRCRAERTASIDSFDLCTSDLVTSLSFFIFFPPFLDTLLACTSPSTLSSLLPWLSLLALLLLLTPLLLLFFLVLVTDGVVKSLLFSLLPLLDSLK